MLLVEIAMLLVEVQAALNYSHALLLVHKVGDLLSLRWVSAILSSDIDGISHSFGLPGIRRAALHAVGAEPQPMQASSSSFGSAFPQKPISFSIGLEQALGQAETVA